MGSGGATKVGIVTVTYNSAEVLPDFFRSLWSQTHRNFILYAVDNASSDSTVELLHAEKDCRLRVVANCRNLGVAEGNNRGIRLALEDDCESVLLLNNDVVFPTALLTRLLSSKEINRCEMVAPRMMYYQPSDEIWWAGGHFQKILGYRAIHDDMCGGGQRKAALRRRTTYAPTCCVLVDSKVFARIGLMDDQYFVYFDDTDFMFRAWQADMILIYEPEAVLYHKVSSLTKGTTSQFAVRHITRNRIYFWSKHFGTVPAFAGIVVLAAIYLLRVIVRRASVQVLTVQLKALREGFQMHLRISRSKESRELDAPNDPSP
jgi:GT2 family glycosyltransferase